MEENGGLQELVMCASGVNTGEGGRRRTDLKYLFLCVHFF